jgi:proline iminopeptidase
MYPAIEPYAHGMLATGDGNSLYWECCGNPQGKPALVLHGGPGSGCSPTHRRYFDPAAYNIVLLDQRQCGRSTPSARDPATDLSANTTAHLLADIEALREHLGIQRWLVLGGSWGCTLALAYAQHAPHRVTEMVLHAIATTSPIETGWITEGVRRLLRKPGKPSAPARHKGRCPTPMQACWRARTRRSGTKPRATGARGKWRCSTPRPAMPQARWRDAGFRYGFARLVTHYWRHAAWLEDGALLRDAGKLSGIPGVLIHGRLDIGSPLATAWELAKAWPGSDWSCWPPPATAGTTPTWPMRWLPRRTASGLSGR